MAFVLTTQISPLSTGPAISTPNITVVSTNTTSNIIDTISYTSAHSLKWLITIVDDTNNRTRFMEVAAIHRNGVSVMHNIFGDVGDRINVQVEVVLNGPDVELKLTNNSGADLLINTVRINTLPQ